MGTPIEIGATLSLTDFYRDMDAVASHASDLRPVFRQIDTDMTMLLRDQFATQGRTLGTPWAPPSEGTLAVRASRGSTSTKALVDSDGLRQSFVNPRMPGAVRVIDMLSYARGSQYASRSGFPVASVMQTGFTSQTMPVIGRAGQAIFIRRPNGPKRVAARPILPDAMPAPVIRTWEGYVAQYLLGD